VPLLVIQNDLRELRMPPFGAEYVAAWIVIHPAQDMYANLVALVATGVPVVTIATALDDVACSSVVADNRVDTRALVSHVIDHGHRRIAYIAQMNGHKPVIIATSASVFDINRQRSLLAGCNAFLPKPIQVEQLMELLATHMHLTWHYAEAELLDPARQDGADTISLTPPRDELAALFELASIGDILGLQARAAQLAHHDPALRRFAHRLERLASRFEPEQALALIARYIEPYQ
jgi:CheY-like chemotaxis protein